VTIDMFSENGGRPFFEQFKEEMPTNRALCERVAEEVLKDLDELSIKGKFSSLVDEIQDAIYREYLTSQATVGQKVIDASIEETGGVDFDELDKFFLSISQSRKSRAGTAFEYIIQELFRRLSYPADTQVVIEGAKPDFVMPSEEYFRSKPLDSLIFTVKRTLRERWRQVVTEANKGYGYFLATIDEKISANQIQQASENKIFIVTTERNIAGNDAYKDAYSVISFEEFFERHLDPAMRRWDLLPQKSSDSREC